MARKKPPKYKEKKYDMLPRKKLGRPVTFNQDLADRICDKISRGASLRQSCREEKPPIDPGIVCKWVVHSESFYQQYMRARRSQAHLHADELVDIADEKVIDNERARRRIDTRKFILSKVLPKVYGDKLEIEHKVDPVLASRIKEARKRAKEARVDDESD
jgi:hypothetical protein